MESTKYIGRVGALAVALGIGSALTCGTGVAWADEGSDNSGKTDSSTSGDDGKSKESGPTASTTGPANPASCQASRAPDAAIPTVRAVSSGIDRPRKKTAMAKAAI